jgi:outer membrane protein OmpA-like peptidoglycan-associated protein
MKKFLVSFLLFLVLLQVQSGVFAQPLTYSVKKVLFSSDKYDEFSPVYYKNGIVFCTNRKPNLLLDYSSTQDKGLFKIYYADTTSSGEKREPVLLSKVLTTNFNDGPATFSVNFDTIYFSRNLIVEGKLKYISGSKNRLGIFYSVNVDGNWTKPRDMRINNEWYNVTTPFLSPDGKRLYFASDKPGGYGGSDLYYCEWKNDYWNEPVNLGPVINTPGNESYPFINSTGELFFSSDGHPGLGGKDIFFSRLKDGNWTKPIRLDPPINSEFDDFGIVADPLTQTGYFSSNRDKSIDIYKFETIFPQIFYNDIQKENKFCFLFTDTSSIPIDTLNFKYRWDFGDGKHAWGLKASHCFPGAGKFKIRLELIDQATGKLFFTKLSYTIDLEKNDQAYINSRDVVIKGDTLGFDAYRSHIPGYKIIGYSWDFGDGTKAKGEKVIHTYIGTGEYKVNLDLNLKGETTGNLHRTGISKKVTVLNGLQDILAEKNLNSADESYIPDIRKYGGVNISSLYSADAELKMDAVFLVELTSSIAPIALNTSTFHNIPSRFKVKEIIDPKDSTYHYVVDQQLSLMACHTAFNEMIKAGFKNVQVKLLLLKDPAEKELYNILKIFGDQTDTFFDNNDKLMPTSVILLEQIVRILGKYTPIKLEIDVYPDNNGTPESNQISTQEKAIQIENFLANRGVNPARLVAKGFGEPLHTAPDFPAKIRKSTLQVVFTIIR